MGIISSFQKGKKKGWIDRLLGMQIFVAWSFYLLHNCKFEWHSLHCGLNCRLQLVCPVVIVQLGWHSYARWSPYLALSLKEALLVFNDCLYWLSGVIWVFYVGPRGVERANQRRHNSSVFIRRRRTHRWGKNHLICYCLCLLIVQGYC